MLKEFQRESKEIVEKIYEISPPLKIFYLIRQRERGLADISIQEAVSSLTQGLRDFEYAFYNDIQTPELLFDKELAIKKNVLTLNNRMKQVKFKSKPQPFAFEVEPNHDVINQNKDNLLEYLLKKEYPTALQLVPIIESRFLKILPSGSAYIKYEDKWLTFAEIDLRIEEEEVTSNTGRLLVHLIKMKKLNESSYKYSRETIMDVLNFNEKDYQTTVDSIRSAISKVLTTTGEKEKVKLYRERGSKQLVFPNISQNKILFE